MTTLQDELLERGKYGMNSHGNDMRLRLKAADRIDALEAALREAKNAFHGINLCSINSMSSRHEMRRLADEAIARINELLEVK